MSHPTTHTIIYSPTGQGKSTAAKTWVSAGDMLVLMFDPPDKAAPYRKGAKKVVRKTGRYGIVEECHHDTGLIRIEYFHDSSMLKQKPDAKAWTNFRNRLDSLYEAADRFQTICNDSITYAMFAARNWAQFDLMPNAKDARLWTREAADVGEQIFMIGMPSLPVNIVLLSHVRTYKDDDGMVTKSMPLPGRMRDIDCGLPIGYGEYYRLYKTWSERKQRYVRRFQTEPDEEWHACSQINAPNRCLATYDALWQPKKKK